MKKAGLVLLLIAISAFSGYWLSRALWGDKDVSAQKPKAVQQTKPPATQAKPIAQNPPPQKSSESEPKKEKRPRLSKEEMERMIQDIRADFNSRLARVRARAKRLRPVVNGIPEDGNAWEFYNKGITKLKERASDIAKDLKELRNMGWVSSTGFSMHDPDVSCSNVNLTDKEKKAIADVSPEERNKKLAEFVDKYKDVAEIFQKGARQISASQDIPYEKGWDAFPTMSLLDVRGAAHLLAALGDACMAQGQKDKALELYTDGLRFGQDTEGRSLVGQMIAIAIEDMQAEAMTASLPRADASWLNSLGGKLDTLLQNHPSLFDRYDEALLMAEAEVSKTYDMPPEQVLEKVVKSGLGGDKEYSGEEWKEIWVQGVYAAIPLYDKVQEVRALGYEAQRKSFQEISEEVRKNDNPFFSSMLPSFERAGVTDDEMLTSLASLRLSSAVKAYQLNNGRFPVQLSDLIGKGYITNMPLDPFSGDFFKYKVSDDGKTAKVYSIGAKLQDDGGAKLHRFGGLEYDLGFELKADN